MRTNAIVIDCVSTIGVSAACETDVTLVFVGKLGQFVFSQDNR